MRQVFVLVTAAMVMASCSGDPPPPQPDPEICDDEIDNDGDGDIDCDDSDCGGLPCQNQGDDDDSDTGPTGPPPEAEVLYDAESCCDFDFTVQAGCAQGIGSITFINRSLEDSGDFDLSCDQLGGNFPVNFQMATGGSPVPFMTNRPVDPEEQIEVNLLYVCNLNQTFTVDCNAKIEVGALSDEVFFTVTGTLVQ